MRPILKSTSSEDLIYANEENLYDIYRFLARKGDRTLVEESDGMASGERTIPAAK